MSVIALILSAVNATLSSKGADYFRRPRGSFIPSLREAGDEGVATSGFLLTQKWVEVTEEVRGMGAAFGQCRYFRAEIGVPAHEAACLVSELTPEELAEVRLRPGHHGGVELVAETLPLRSTNVVHLIVGHKDGPSLPVYDDDAEGAVVYTWYPGRITPSVKVSDATVKLG